MVLTLYGIPNCDTIRKARAYLDARGVAHRFHDFRKDGIEPVRLRQWADRIGWEWLLNRAGTTFRNLPDTERQGIDLDGALALMLAQPAMIKRPIVEKDDMLLVGFNLAEWNAAVL